uniref:Putative myb-interacting protein 40 n=1 Tax=Corethrella appendiculata TaxID=1370023 RepID=U5EU33_9DIPT
MSKRRNLLDSVEKKKEIIEQTIVEEARSKLNRALEETVTQSDPESNDGAPQRPIKDPNLPLRGRPPKRLKVEEHQYHQTYVMKLFDRSVDLAKFREDCPLYALCRAWIMNQPRAKTGKFRVPNVYIADRVETNDIAKGVKDGIIKEIPVMPAPIPDTDVALLPELLQCQKDSNKNNIKLVYNLNKPPVDRKSLMKQNLKRWRDIRQQWNAHSKEREKRYQPSMDILDAIFRP